MRGAFTPGEIKDLKRLCDVGSKPGVRLDMSAELARLIGAQSSYSNYIEMIGVNSTPVRLVAFNKTPLANWSVPWHQDRVIAVARQCAIPNYTNWVSKSAFWHCEPPIELLQEMVFVRVHIDACDELNGPLELALGSHKHGLVKSEEAAEIAASSEIEMCLAQPGDVLMVKALTVHRSRSSATATPRRALRIDYAKRDALDERLRWAYGD